MSKVKVNFKYIYRVGNLKVDEGDAVLFVIQITEMHPLLKAANPLYPPMIKVGRLFSRYRPCHQWSRKETV